MNEQYDLAVIGGGFAGVCAAESFADAAAGSRTLLINGEDRTPYKRTKISKHLHCGYTPDEFSLQSALWYQEHGIEIVRAQVAVLNAEARRMTLSNGEELSARAIVLATGARPRHDWSGASHVLRSARDGDVLRSALCDGGDAVVIGAGVLGVEVAEQLCRCGLRVVVLNRGAFLMPKRLNRSRAEWLESLFMAKGIRCMHEVSVVSAQRDPNGRKTVRSQHREWPADVVVECTGTRPNIGLAIAAGLHTDDGICVNSLLETSCPGIFAAGDCVQFANGEVPFLWHQAEDQGRNVGVNAAQWIAGRPMHTFVNAPRRLKTEPFGEFIFSMNAARRGDMDRLCCCEADDVYQEFGFRQDALHTVVMSGDKVRAKEYETAIWEQWDPARVRSELAAGPLHSSELE